MSATTGNNSTKSFPYIFLSARRPSLSLVSFGTVYFCDFIRLVIFIRIYIVTMKAKFHQFHAKIKIMLSKENLEELLQTALRNGGDFAEIFLEETNTTAISCEDNKIERIASGTDIGAGIRVISGTETVYVATSDTSFESLREAALKISDSISGQKNKHKIELTPTVSTQM